MHGSRAHMLNCVHQEVHSSATGPWRNCEDTWYLSPIVPCQGKVQRTKTA